MRAAVRRSPHTPIHGPLYRSTKRVATSIGLPAADVRRSVMVQSAHLASEVPCLTARLSGWEVSGRPLGAHHAAISHTARPLATPLLDPDHCRRGRRAPGGLRRPADPAGPTAGAGPEAG